MTPDEMHAKHFSKDYTRGYNDCNKHRTSSQPTLDQFKSMNEEINKIKVTLGEHGKDISYIRKNGDDVKKTIEDFIKKADECYARKDNVVKLDARVTKVFWASGTAVISSLTAIIWFLVNFIISKK